MIARYNNKTATATVNIRPATAANNQTPDVGEPSIHTGKPLTPTNRKKSNLGWGEERTPDWWGFIANGWHVSR